ncbi:MAG TPA: hypothetical protein VJ385_08770 [Fibrobacteria bacterium]|nr:hypothetical protein [Fibrobacteria bacterium]
MAGLSLALKFDESALSAEPVVRRNRAELPILSAGRPAPRLRKAAREGWENRVRAEYEGMTLARRFHGLSVELNAPMDIQELALRMTLQEQQHARYCMAAAASLGSAGLITFEAARLGAPEGARDPRQAFWEMVCGPYAVSEVAAFRLLSASLRMLPPSGYKGILETILEDESLHARIGFLILSSARLPRRKRRPDWIEAPSDAWIRAYASRFIEAGLRRDVIDPAEAALFADPAGDRALRALGIPPSEAFKSAYFDALRKDVPRRFKALGLVL